MNIADAFVIILVMASIMVGANFGLVRQTTIGLGTLLGLHVAALVSARMMQATDSNNLRLLIVIVIVVLIVALFFDMGLSVGSWLNRKLHHIHKLELLNKTAGAIVGCVTAVIFAWLSGAILANSPQAAVAGQVRASAFLTALNTNWPPPPDAIAYARHAIRPFEMPQIFIGAEPTVGQGVVGVLPDRLRAVATKAEQSVVKVQGHACGSESVGSGFVAFDDIVVTNAHVVAGIREPFVQSSQGLHTATVVRFDPGLDVAVLRVQGLDAPTLPIKDGQQNAGTIGAVIGYPDGGGISSGYAVVRSAIGADGFDIYDRTKVMRRVYAINATVVPGHSGGPLVDESGAVIGLVFGHSLDRPNVGYALVMSPVSDVIQTGIRQQGPVSTGNCTSA